MPETRNRPAAPRGRLTRDDWVEAAVAMVGEVGVDRLAVEPLAARLNATKGSFYWHFTDRAALLDAVVANWESTATARIIEDVNAAPPTDRLRRLIETAIGHPSDDHVEWMILSAADHPRVGPVVERVHRNRLDYLRGLFAAAGVSAAAARARITYAAYLGHLQLSVAGGVQTDPDARRAFVDEIVATLGTSERSD